MVLGGFPDGFGRLLGAFWVDFGRNFERIFDVFGKGLLTLILFLWDKFSWILRVSDLLVDSYFAMWNKF